MNKEEEKNLLEGSSLLYSIFVLYSQITTFSSGLQAILQLS